MSDAPLMELEESLIYGLWPKRLRIFQDRIETQDFVLLRETSESRKYGWVDHVTVSGRRSFANLLIRSHWGKPILMRGLSKDDAERAKALIEERAARDKERSLRSRKPSANPDAAELVRKLAELRDAGVLSREEFEAKKAVAMAMEQNLPEDSSAGA